MIKKRSFLSLGVLFLSIGVLLGGGTPAQALSAIWTHGYETGYFDGLPANHGCYNWAVEGLSGDRSCFVIPEGLWGVNTVGAFMSVIKANYYSGSYARMTGAAFIVHSMLGHAQMTVSRNVSDAEFNDLENRMNILNAAGEINWYANHSTTSDGGLDPNVDVYVANAYQAGPSILINDLSGNLVYALFIECANPDGDLTNGLPAVNYKLTPTITTNPVNGQSVSPSDSIRVKPVVANAGPTISSPNVDWQLSQFVVPPGGSYPTTMQSNGNSPADQYGNNLQRLDGGTGFFDLGNTKIGTGSYDIPDKPVGTKICYALSVRPYSQTTGDWRHSTPSCLLIGKKPMIQVLGGDLRVGAAFTGGTPQSSLISTSTTSKDGGGKIYGSWAEYGVFAPSTVTGLASLSGLAGADGNTSNSQSDWSKLTFANQPTKNCPDGFGCYNDAASMGTIPDLDSRYFKAGEPDTAGGLNLHQGAGVHTYMHTGDLSIGGDTIEAGQSYIIKATGTVTITGDIHYTGDRLHAVSDIPQLVIIAKNINIAENVTNIDAWLVAEGTTDSNTGILNTCANGGTVTTPLTADVCGATLTVNGPVMAQHLWLRRTAGAGTHAASGDPAEVFNLRSDAYLWAISQVQGSGRAQTVYTKELPPRF